MALTQDMPVASIAVDGQTYLPVGPEWSGFYDWLRNLEGRILGVRYHAVDETSFVLKAASQLKYVELERSSLAIFFTEDHRFDVRESVDQAFIYDQVFMTGDGACCIAFATDNLSNDQLKSVKDLHIDRLNVAIQYGPRET
jgi:hypothetical protein